jgi:hypothetical protein
VSTAVPLRVPMTAGLTDGQRVTVNGDAGSVTAAADEP